MQEDSNHVFVPESHIVHPSFKIFSGEALNANINIPAKMCGLNTALNFLSLYEDKSL